MPLWFNKKLNLTEDEIRTVMEIGTSQENMAQLLGVCHETFVRYAKNMIDPETGLTFQKLSTIIGKRNKKKMKMETKRQKTENFKKISISAILAGKHPTYNRTKLKARLISEGIFEEKCQICGFEERRILDFQVPLILLFKDGNKQNHQYENLEFCCYNCFFLNYNDLKIKTDNYTLNRLYKVNI